jgi:hypothetical protein
MKKSLFLTSGLLIAAQIFAQKQDSKINICHEVISKPGITSEIPETAPSEFENRAAFDTIQNYYWDFANQLPATWTATDVLGNGNWAWTDQPPQGQFAEGIPVIASTTSANGFMILDGDFYNPGAPSTYRKMDAYIQTPVLNLSGYPDVMLRYQQFFRYCCNESEIKILVQVSTNGGVNFTDFDTRDGVRVNSTSVNAAQKALNISALAGGQSNVVIRFRVSGASHYFWMIDDVAITEPAQNDLLLNKQYLDFIVPEGGYYTRIPKTQLGELTFKAAIKNIGSATQTDVKLNVVVKKAATEVFNGSSVGKSEARLAEDTLQIGVGNGYTPSLIGTYSVKYNIVQQETEQVPTNDTLPPFSFIVNDTVYARDNNLLTGRTISTGNFVGGEGEGSRLVTEYVGINPGKLLSVSVYLDTNRAAIGTYFKAIVYKVGTSAFEPLLESDFYDITAANQLGKWVHLPLITNGESELISDSTTYLVGIEVYGSSPTKNIYIPIDVSTPHPIRTSFIYPAGASSPAWGYTTYGQAFIRLNVGEVDASLKKVENKGFSLGQNQPNPANSFSTIEYSLEKPSTVTLEITDLSGKLIEQFSQGRKPIGKFQIGINTSTYSAGTYFYTLKTDLGMQTKKMIITK